MVIECKFRKARVRKQTSPDFPAKFQAIRSGTPGVTQDRRPGAGLVDSAHSGQFRGVSARKLTRGAEILKRFSLAKFDT